MRKAESVWDANSDGAITLVGRWNYHNELSAQFPIAALRVVYAKAGILPAACLLRDPRGVDHMLYWMAPSTEAEARYLVSILNSETGRKRIEQYQARGQFGARHFDKIQFNVPIPGFDPTNKLDLALADAAAQAERIAAAVELPAGVRLQRARSLIRAALSEKQISREIDGRVAALLDRA